MANPLFRKLNYINFFKILLCVKSNEAKIIAYIIRYMDYDNRIYMDRSEVSLSVGCSEDTVSNITTDLIQCDFIHKNGINRYMVNPDCVYKGPDARLPYLKKECDSLI